MGTAESKKKFNLKVEDIKHIRYPKGVGYYNWKYSGCMKKGKKHGYGVYDWSNNTTLSGEWVEDQITEGKMTYSNNDTFEGSVTAIPKQVEESGTFVDTYHTYFTYYADGNGIFTQASSGFTIKGKFLDRKVIIGFGKSIEQNGNIYEGNWFNGTWHYKGTVWVIDKPLYGEIKIRSHTGYFYNGKFIGKEITDEVHRVLFPNTKIGSEYFNEEYHEETQEENPKAEQEGIEYKEQTTLNPCEVQPNAPEAEKEGEEQVIQHTGHAENVQPDVPEVEQEGESSESEEEQEEESGEEEQEESQITQRKLQPGAALVC
jgi:hypothetical protein